MNNRSFYFLNLKDIKVSLYFKIPKCLINFKRRPTFRLNFFLNRLIMMWLPVKHRFRLKDRILI